jgi:hypothetical protein
MNPVIVPPAGAVQDLLLISQAIAEAGGQEVLKKIAQRSKELEKDAAELALESARLEKLRVRDEENRVSVGKMMEQARAELARAEKAGAAASESMKASRVLEREAKDGLVKAQAEAFRLEEELRIRDAAVTHREQSVTADGEKARALVKEYEDKLAAIKRATGG